MTQTAKKHKARDALKNLFMVKRTREFNINKTINKRHKYGGMLAMAVAPCTERCERHTIMGHFVVV